MGRHTHNSSRNLTTSPTPHFAQSIHLSPSFWTDTACILSGKQKPMSRLDSPLRPCQLRHMQCPSYRPASAG
ncbi:hypothetical protein JMJ77_0005331 [Colletotrichum scovillei]|uniref:Uncharacterized protein n=1 Tax=Colletotrichum scovillei TaxID=1209932 RepID=A0A9P7RK51_9PEZI|nr:hypothetical protein JMJ77_0005331 [Colletotrichum scovillei]KAG7076547.1 hypothetical protein JMJ76_0013810 [Colletotrichum scovillei]KAG7083623.1 hypothetical protein JMJ78_0009068 [Colletotrichum scovillei]